MAGYYILIFIACFLIGAFSQTCKDWISNCASWNNFCSRSDAHTYCKKTCGGCASLPSCGRSLVSQGRVVKGVDAKPGAWPWIASLQKNNGHYCGSTLLTPTWVITAAHCVGKITSATKYQWTIKLGAHNHRNFEGSAQRISIKRVIIHPKYSRSTLIADMAMIELQQPAMLNSRVTVACLPNKGVYPSFGRECFVAGWGAITHPGSVYHVLQQTKLPVVPSSNCKHQNEVVCVGKGFSNQPDGSQQPNACRGDSGGPLVCRRSDGSWVLEGVASFVHTYCKYYTGYAPVNKYLDWINGYISS